MISRKPEDLLREEYFALLPHIRSAAEELEVEVRFLLMPLVRELEPHERIVIKSRVKECESAITSLRRRQEPGEFDDDTDSFSTSLTALNDLAGVRVLAFPKRRVLEIDNVLRSRFWEWTSDPVPPAPGTANSLALKYHGYCNNHRQVRTEIQLMSMLVGMFWEVEHAALYKPGPRLRGMEISLKMQDRNAEVIRALNAFEAQFEALACAKPSSAAPSAAPH